MNKKNIIYDFAIIGGGVLGSAIARELSKYNCKVLVIEKNNDLCFETSGRNSGVVHAGFSYDTGSLKNIFCLKGNLMFDQLSKDLSFPFKRCGKLLVGKSQEDLETLKRVLKQGEANGVKNMELICGQEKIANIVPYTIGNYAVFSHNSGITDPFLFNIALAENAHLNGVSFVFNEEVIGIEKEEDLYKIKSPKNSFRSKWIINSAGLNCGKISKMMGIDSYKVIGSKGEYIILNKECGKDLPMPVYPVPSNTYMGIHVTNTVDGNVLVGPNAENVSDFTNYTVSKIGVEGLAKSANDLWNRVYRKDFIRTYAGILPKWVDENNIIQDFKIEIKDEVKNFVNLIGIESPGLTAAVPLAQYVLKLIKDRIKLEEKENFISKMPKKKKFSHMTFEEKKEAIKNNPDFGEIICRCEHVSKAEILNAINNPLGRCSFKSIKYRTRAMTGLCQGGYCQMRIEEMIKEEKNLKDEDILYGNENTNMFPSNVREI